MNTNKTLYYPMVYVAPTGTISVLLEMGVVVEVFFIYF